MSKLHHAINAVPPKSKHKVTCELGGKHDPATHEGKNHHGDYIKWDECRKCGKLISWR